MIRSSLVLLLGAMFGAGCASTQEIETAPPQPRTDVFGDDGESAREAPFTVLMAQGETPLPDDVSRMRFRITEVRLRRATGQWVRLPSDAAPIEITGETDGARKTLLDARVIPEPYDSLTIRFDDVFARFGQNAGGPLTTAREAPQRLAIDVEPALGARTTVVLRFEPGASLTRSPDCRWFFLPVLRSDVETTPLVPPDDARR